MIEIVKVSRDESTGEIEQTTISTIDDIEVFLKDFSQVNCYLIYTDPKGIDDSALVIKIVYQDGEYELIDVRGQDVYKRQGYWYNADGIRTKKIRSNGEVTDYYLNGSNIITMITNSVMDPENPKRLDFYYDEQGDLLGFRYNGQDYWYIRNGQGDIAGILDSTGTQVVSYTYDRCV